MLVALTLTGVLAGVAAAQDTRSDPCQRYVDDLRWHRERFAERVVHESELRLAERALRECRDREIVVTQQQHITAVRSAARDWLNRQLIQDYSRYQVIPAGTGHCRSDLAGDNPFCAALPPSRPGDAERDAYRQAIREKRQFEQDNGISPQPFNDGVPDWYRYWCIERDGRTGSNNLNGDTC